MSNHLGIRPHLFHSFVTKSVRDSSLDVHERTGQLGPHYLQFSQELGCGCHGVFRLFLIPQATVFEPRRVNASVSPNRLSGMQGGRAGTCVEIPALHRNLDTFLASHPTDDHGACATTWCKVVPLSCHLLISLCPAIWAGSGCAYWWPCIILGRLGNHKVKSCHHS